MTCESCNATDQNDAFCTICGAEMGTKSFTPEVELPVAQQAQPIFASETLTTQAQNPLAKPELITTNDYQDEDAAPSSSAPAPAALVNPSLSTKTSSTAIAALISVFFIPLLGLILGYVARKEISNSEDRLSGLGLSKASIVLGWIFVSIGALFSLLILVAIVT